jgi:ubiquinone biosynthesis protein
MKLGRIAEISKVFVAEGLGLHDEPPESGADQSSTDRQRAARLRRALERLGATFVKFGQILATRVDLFSEEFLDELGKLRSHVPSFPIEDARAILEEDLSKPIDEVFIDFPEEPVASASVAQVYKARLRSSGDMVAVKVQRPNLQEQVSSDLNVLMEVSKFVDRLVPAYHRSMVHQVAAEYASRARQEMDFLAEAHAIERFSEVLTTLPEFRAPRVELELCTSRVLVMEWFEGPQLEQVKTAPELKKLGFSPRALASSMLRLQLGMSYEHGFVHGDTHPGNIILLEDGHYGLIDFGLHGFVSRQLCDKMLELLFYQSSGQTDEAVTAFLQIFSPSPEIDLEGFEQELREILAQTGASTAAGNKLTKQLVDGLRVGARYQLKAQSELFIVIRNLAIVEGIVLTYAPDMDLLSEVRDILGGILQRRALGTPIRGEYKELIPMLMLTFSQRPRLAERLMRLERSFTESRNLGEFLRKEGVYDEQRPIQAPSQFKTLTLLVIVGFVLLGVWQWFLAGGLD